MIPIKPRQQTSRPIKELFNLNFSVMNKKVEEKKENGKNAAERSAGSRGTKNDSSSSTKKQSKNCECGSKN